MAQTQISEQSNQILEQILNEIRILRKEIEFLIPCEDLTTYEHPERIQSSYTDAIRQYPPLLQ